MKKNPLEDAVLEKNNALVIQEIAEGRRIQDPAVLASDEAFALKLKVFYALIEIGSSAETREEALAILQERDPADERIELLEEARQPLPTKPHAFEKNLFKAILVGDGDAIQKILETPSKRLRTMPSAEVLKAFLKVDRKVIRRFLSDGVDFRCQAHLLGKFLQECEKPEELADCSYEQRIELANLLIGVFMNAEDDGDDEDGSACGSEEDKHRQEEALEALQEDAELYIRAYLELLEIPFKFKAKKKLFLFSASGKNSDCALSVNLMIEKFFVIYRGVLPVLCQEERRMAVAEFLTRINNEIPMGNFEMDFQTGSIAIKMTMPHEAIVSNPTKILSLFPALSDFLMEKCGSLLLAVLRGERTPEEAAGIATGRIRLADQKKKCAR